MYEYLLEENNFLKKQIISINKSTKGGNKNK